MHALFMSIFVGEHQNRASGGMLGALVKFRAGVAGRNSSRWFAVSRCVHSGGTSAVRASRVKVNHAAKTHDASKANKT